ncbi:trafficking protein particle complex subunit 4-like protein [Dinothrombium tinctorium]|uniref:Trafficking protein particle complex subunit n=1 Tax=Dinothrombium tinctorium TaxID=1965070 RepID=A0A3S3PCR3_9ACAR|nr:trafficking protein particle complex subunit 4-like protein [Dinothrombium tinctorium]
MVIYSVLIISKSGGLIYHFDCYSVDTEIEKTLSFPLDLKLEYINQRITVTFGQRDGIKVGFALLAINGEDVNGRKLGDKDVLDEILNNEENYPINLKFGIPKLTTNEKIVLASMFHSMYAIAALQIQAPKNKDGSKSKSSCSGIEVLETDNFRLNCFQTLTGVKFIIISDLSPINPGSKESLLRKIYELYADYALKNPFYSLEMPIRCELFDSNLQTLLEQHEKTGVTTM